MPHYDEHILELYALGSSVVEHQRAEIKSHVADCRRCGEVVEAFLDLYRLAATDFEEGTAVVVPDRPANTSRALQVASPHGPVARTPDLHLTPGSRARYFIQRHPIIAGSGTFAALALTTALLVTFLRPARNEQPAYHHLNESAGSLEIYDKGNKLLWSVPVKNVRAIMSQEESRGNSHTVVADLNNDGTNEVISAIPGLGATGDEPDVVGLFSPDGKEISKAQLSHEVRFCGAIYPSSLALTGILVDKFGPNNEDLIVAEGATGRSPYMVATLDNKNRVRGEYWHFGNFSYSGLLIDPTTGQHALVLAGSNDIADSVDEAFGVLTVLLPERIAGKTESAVTPGFGFAPSVAELYYVRLPRMSLAAFDNVKPSIFSLQVRKDGQGERIQLRTGVSQPARAYVIEYTFDADLRLLSVKTDDRTRELLESLRGAKKSKTSGTVEYLQGLASQVRYWNGSTWVDQPFRLAH